MCGYIYIGRLDQHESIQWYMTICFVNLLVFEILVYCIVIKELIDTDYATKKGSVPALKNLS